MKLMHTSDWHLGLDFYGQDLLADQRHMIGRIVHIAREEQVEAVLDNHGVVYEKSETWIPEEQLYEVFYECEELM